MEDSSKINVLLELPPERLEWLEARAASQGLPSSGKALRCCINFAAQTGLTSFNCCSGGGGGTGEAPGGEDGPSTVVSFQLSPEQAAWLQDVAYRTYGGDSSEAASALVGHCASEVSEEEVFGVIRCKSSTPATCEGYVAAVEAAGTGALLGEAGSGATPCYDGQEGLDGCHECACAPGEEP
eukprot:TRINITY_DN49852_c0_g1_i1.p1 TRINITY_DN49852_c0_g1~~TRINITY_DN49852_c0_g1_i1.p1  ORF type:complete len:182 (-),score=51.84 TRINITY_DN49852_c0_g1_i1:37-582(-)